MRSYHGRNDRLSEVAAAEPAAIEVRSRYLDRWVMWDPVRTDAAMMVAPLYALGVTQS